MLKATEASILGAAAELKEIVVESGNMAESLFERVNDGYKDLTVSVQRGGGGGRGLAQFGWSKNDLFLIGSNQFF